MNFAAIPSIPQGGGIDPWQFRLLTAMKQNIEILSGARDSGEFSAILKGSMSGFPKLAEMDMKQITARGEYVTISGSDVPLVSDYINLMASVQVLANDVNRLYATVNALIGAVRD